MANQESRRTLRTLWEHHKKGIIVTGVILLIASGSAIILKLNYWKDVFKDSWKVVEDLTGQTKTSIIALAVIPVLLWYLKSLFQSKGNKGKSFWKAIVSPAVSVLSLYAFVVLFYTVFWAQPKMFQTTYSQLKIAQTDLAKNQPPQGQLSYSELHDQWTNALSKSKQDKERADKADESAAKFRSDWLGSLRFCTSNSIAAAQAGVAAAIKNYKDRISSVNTNEETSLAAIRARSQHENELKELEATEALLTETARMLPFYAMAEHFANQYGSQVTNLVSNCGGVVEPISIPELKWFAGNAKSFTAQTLSYKVSTNCAFFANGYFPTGLNPAVQLRVGRLRSGEKPKTSHALIQFVGNKLQTEFEIANEGVKDYVNCDLSDTDKCFARIDKMVRLMFEAVQ
jgi:hypothetical protein